MKTGSWIVTMTCTVVKEVVCDDCTEAQARDDPFEHAVDETEMYQEEYHVTRVKSND